MNAYLDIKQKFALIQNEENANAMAKYMRNQFAFYGIPTPKRKEVYKEFIKQEKKKKTIDWNLLNTCYKDEHREFQYFVYDYLLAMKHFVKYEDLPYIKNYIITKSWWDTIDFLCKVIGDVSLRDPNVKTVMVNWSKQENIWLVRSAIEHQLLLKDKTDTALLETIIKNNFNSNEFFINKAIGWALREYSKTNQIWVQEFIDKYKDHLDKLTIKEASKYL